jgi:hypothetical protein
VSQRAMTETLVLERIIQVARTVVFLDKEERLFPGSDHPGQEHQEKPVPFPVDRSFDVATKDDQLVSSQGVLRKQCGCSSGHLGACSEQK